MKRERLIRVIEEVLEGPFWHVTRERIADKVLAAYGDEQAELRARRKAPETSHDAVAKIREGTVMAEALGCFQAVGRGGLIDDELESMMNRTHQSASSARNTLMRRGFVAPTEYRRLTRYGNPAVVYAWTGKV